MNELRSIRRTLADFKAKTLLHSADVDLAGSWGAVAIGAASELDRVWLVPLKGDSRPGTSGPVSPDPGDVTAPPAGSYLISVERPLIGPVEGPFVIFPAYGRTIHHVGTPDQAERWFPVIDNTGASDVDVILGPRQRPAYLDLDFYSCAPPWLPTKRSPVVYPISDVNFGTTGASSRTYWIPGWGRKTLSLTMRMAGTISAGDIDWSLSGVNSGGAIGTGSVRAYGTVVLGSGTEAANFEDTSYFTGEFDWYEFTVAEGNPITGSVTLDTIIKLWD